jgi:uncharacterized membrane protein
MSLNFALPVYAGNALFSVFFFIFGSFIVSFVSLFRYTQGNINKNSADVIVNMISSALFPTTFMALGKT